MEKEIKIFENEEFGSVRTLKEEAGRVVFCGKDVAAALGYTNSRDAIATHVFADDKGGGRKYRHPWRQTENDNN